MRLATSDGGSELSGSSQTAAGSGEAMALLSSETDSLVAQLSDVMARLNLLSHPAGESAARLFLVATLRPLATHQRKRVIAWLLRHDLMRGVFD